MATSAEEKDKVDETLSSASDKAENGGSSSQPSEPHGSPDKVQSPKSPSKTSDWKDMFSLPFLSKKLSRSESSDATTPPPVIRGKTRKESGETNNSDQHSVRLKFREASEVERGNLLQAVRLAVRQLIDASLKHGRTVEEADYPLQHFCVVIEHVLLHKLKARTGLLRDKPDLWKVLEPCEKLHPSAADISASVKQMNCKTALGRARAWLQLALMQKHLGEYFRALIDARDTALKDCYEEGAVMLGEEAVPIAGHITGLNVIDFNLYCNEDDLDQPVGVVDYGQYLQRTGVDQQAEDDTQQPDNDQMTAILDQKNYLEERNKNLEDTIASLQQQVSSAAPRTSSLKEELAGVHNSLLDVQADNRQLQEQINELDASHRRQLETSKQDLDVERDTYVTSRAGLDSLYAETAVRLEEETQMRQEVEKELELQVSMKLEAEMASRLLEKDMHEKQDSIISLRKQLDEVKDINLQLYTKLQECEASLKYKAELVKKLEMKAEEVVDSMRGLEDRLMQVESDKQAAEETARHVGQQLAEKDAKRSALETDLLIEREWRVALQQQLEEVKGIVATQQDQLEQGTLVQKELAEMKKQYRALQGNCEEQEHALQELGGHLSESKLKVEDLREAHMAFKDSHWKDDKDVTNCFGCTEKFNVTRRKHHCRKCGEIFCAECSDNKMPMASSAKPVRVCDQCHTLLLERYSAN